MKTVILIPCYNEAQTVGKVIDDFKKAAPGAEIFVYDNNSTDETSEIAMERGAVVVREFQQGKGFVLRSMFRDVDADCYILVDGDDTYEAADAVRLSEFIISGQADMAIGDRLSGAYFTENKRRFHNAGNRVVRFLINKIFHSGVRDILTGCRAFSRRFVKNFPILSGGFEIETEMVIHALDKRFLLVETPIEYRDRPEGSVSKLNTLSDGVKVLKTIFTLFKDYRPMQFFGAFGVIALLASAAFFVPVLTEFVQTGLVPRFPTMIASAVMALVALLLLMCGVILDTIKKYQNQSYELHMNLTELIEAASARPPENRGERAERD